MLNSCRGQTGGPGLCQRTGFTPPESRGDATWEPPHPMGLAGECCVRLLPQVGKPRTAREGRGLTCLWSPARPHSGDRPAPWAPSTGSGQLTRGSVSFLTDVFQPFFPETQVETEKGSEKDPRGHQMPPHPGPGLRGAPPVSSADLTPRSPPPSGPTFLDFSLWSLLRWRHARNHQRGSINTPRGELYQSRYLLFQVNGTVSGGCPAPHPSRLTVGAQLPRAARGFRGSFHSWGQGAGGGHARHG